MKARATNQMLQRARAFIRQEASALEKLADELTGQICAAAAEILTSRGRVVVTGVGKSRLVGEKISATLTSTGTPSITLDPTDAMHGDLGRISPDDILVALSNSGETPELSTLVACVRRIPVMVIAITGGPTSSLAKLSDIVLDIGKLEEACPLGLAPTTSTTAMMALGDALALLLLEQRGFTREDFARSHPAGSLGKRLMRVRDLMRKDDQLPVVPSGTSLAEAMLAMQKTDGRPGAVLVVDGDGHLAGMFTQHDLERLVHRKDKAVFTKPVDDIMQANPTTVAEDLVVQDLFRVSDIFQARHFPVLDHRRTPIGLLDMSDIKGFEPVPKGRAPVRRLSVVS